MPRKAPSEVSPSCRPLQMRGDLRSRFFEKLAPMLLSGLWLHGFGNCGKKGKSLTGWKHWNRLARSAKRILSLEHPRDGPAAFKLCSLPFRSLAISVTEQ